MAAERSELSLIPLVLAGGLVAGLWWLGRVGAGPGALAAAVPIDQPAGWVPFSGAPGPPGPSGPAGLGSSPAEILGAIKASPRLELNEGRAFQHAFTGGGGEIRWDLSPVNPDPTKPGYFTLFRNSKSPAAFVVFTPGTARQTFNVNAGSGNVWANGDVELGGNLVLKDAATAKRYGVVIYNGVLGMVPL